jgi:hypothetical protein
MDEIWFIFGGIAILFEIWSEWRKRRARQEAEQEPHEIRPVRPVANKTVREDNAYLFSVPTGKRTTGARIAGTRTVDTRMSDMARARAAETRGTDDIEEQAWDDDLSEAVAMDTPVPASRDIDRDVLSAEAASIEGTSFESDTPKRLDARDRRGPRVVPERPQGENRDRSRPPPRFAVTGAAFQGAALVRHRLALTPATARQAVVWTEILGPPKGLS